MDENRGLSLQGGFAAVGDFSGMRNVPMVFIRAHGITEIGKDIETLACHGGRVVAVRQGNILATTFHPELTRDVRIHSYFLDMARTFSGNRLTIRKGK